jgi:hypothetical protein
MSRVIVLTVIAIGLTALGLLWLWSVGSEARRLLEGLGLPPGAHELSDVELQGPDGPMPEIATRSFRAPGKAEVLERFFFDRCKQTGLSEPRPESARLEPELLCERWRTGGFDVVLLSTSCERDDCRATLVVRSFDM